MIRIVAALVGLLAVTPLGADAATLYVNNSGSPACSDGTAKASNTASNPWCTLGRAVWGNASRSTPSAAEAAAAGDTVLVSAGTYSTSQGSANDNIPTYNPANSGSSGSPITFQASGTVTLTYTASSVYGPVIGASSVNYITWDGFTIDEANAINKQDSGTVEFWTTTGSIAKNLILKGYSQGYTAGAVLANYGTNHGGVRIERAVSVTVQNCRIHNYYVDPALINWINGNGLEVYDSYGLVIEHNEIYDNGAGFFHKGQQVPTLGAANDSVRYNLFYGNGAGIVAHITERTGAGIYSIYHNNIVRDGVEAGTGTGTYGVVLKGFSTLTTQGPWNNYYINNTVDNVQYCARLASVELNNTSGNEMQNNLFTNCTTRAILNDASTLSFETDRVLFERNWYWTYGQFLDDVGVNRTFAQFQSTYVGQEVNGTNATDPSYVNAAINNFRLNVGSSALTAGRVVHSIGGTNGATIPVGAYITGSELIGVTSAISPTVVSGSVSFSGRVVIQ